jgi:hypothetical protein
MRRGFGTKRRQGERGVGTRCDPSEEVFASLDERKFLASSGFLGSRRGPSFQTHSRATAILRYKLDARLFEGFTQLHFRTLLRRQLARPSFKSLHAGE